MVFPPFFPWTCTSQRTGTGPRRSTDDWDACGEVRENMFPYSSKLPGQSPPPPPPYHTAQSVLAQLYAMEMNR